MGLFGFGNNKKDNTQKGAGAGDFCSFVLLEEFGWDKKQFMEDFKRDWGIDVYTEEDDKEKFEDIVLYEYQGMRLAISYIQGIDKNHEAEQVAATNYMWKEAVEVVSRRKAQIMVAVLGNKTTQDPVESALLHAKAVASCLHQKHVLAVWGEGMIFQPEFYQAFSEMMKEDGLPVPIMVWFGLYKDKKRVGCYTFGMNKFGKDDMEVYIDIKDMEKTDMNELRNFVLDVATYVISEDVVLQDGETIGFTEWQKLTITKSKGIALDGKTLKIAYK